MHNLVPKFILEQFDNERYGGQFEAVCLFVDTSGFTPLTTALMAYGSEGTEILVDVLAAVFSPLVQIVYEQGGFVAGYAGDAFKAVFPLPKRDRQVVYSRAVVAAWQIKQVMSNRASFVVYGDTFELEVKATIADGLVVWGIWEGVQPQTIRAQNAVYFFEGEGLARCLAADPLAEAGEVVLTTAVMNQLRPTAVQADPIADHCRLRAVAADWLAVYSALPVSEGKVASVTATFFPQDLLNLPTQGEFRQVVSLFVSLQWMPEETAVHETIFRLLAQYGGYLCRVGRIGSLDQGGTLLLFWGAPHSHENDVARALGFVLDLQAALPMPLKAGLTFNQAYAGFIGAPQREEYTCYGTYVNLAARQMVMAAWGEIWLDGETAAKAEADFALRLQGEYQFKGFVEKVLVYRLNGRRESQQRYLYDGRLVGRGRELEALAEGVEPVWNGRCGGFILISGEAGLGKSRLAYEFTTGLLDRASLFLCQTDEILRGSLHPFRYWLRHYFGQTAEGMTNRETFEHILDELVTITPDAYLQTELQRTRSFLAALVDLHWPDSLYSQLEPKLRFANTLTALIALIKAESLRRPVVLYVEDVHWLDEDSQQLLQQLLHEGAGYPFVVLATTRPRQTAVVNQLATLTIPLTALDAEALTELAEAKLGGNVSVELGQLLAARAGGNPFFSEQLLLYLQEHELLHCDHDVWQVVANEDVLLPTDVRSLLVARLDRLPPIVKQVVQTAAVLGREFSLPVLAQMVGERMNVLAQVQTAVEATIWVALGEVRFFFKHALLRDAAYEMQRHAQRRHLHQVAADSLKMIYAADLQPHYADLAHHYEQAGIVQQAIYYLKLAGDLVGEAYQNKQAIDFYSRALALVSAGDEDGRYQLLLAREGIYALLGDREREQQDLSALQQLVESLDHTPYQVEVALRQAHHYFHVSDYNNAEAEADKALQLAKTTEDAYLIIEAYLQFGQSLWSHGQYEMATSHLSQALQLAEQIDHPRARALGLRLLGNVAGVQGRYGEANKNFQQARLISRAIGNRQNEVECLNGLGVVAYFQGDFERASQYHRLGVQARREIGDRVGEAKTLGNLADALFRQGIMADVQTYYRQSLAMRQEVDDKLGVAWVLDKLGELCWFEGNVLQARQNYEQALQIRQEVNNLRDSEWSLNNVAAVYRAQGDYHQAQAYHQQALELSHSLKDRDGEALTRHHLGVLAHVQADFVEAQQNYEAALAIHRELNSHAGEALTLNYLALLNNHQGRHKQSLEYSQRALALAQKIHYQDYLAIAWLFRGHAYADLSCWAEAKAAYEEAYTIRQGLQQPVLALEAQVGLMGVTLAEGDIVQIPEAMLGELADLKEENIAILYDMPRFYMTYYRLLNCGGDEGQARAVLGWVYEVLLGRTAVLSATERQMFWQNHPWYRAIWLAWQQP